MCLSVGSSVQSGARSLLYFDTLGTAPRSRGKPSALTYGYPPSPRGSGFSGVTKGALGSFGEGCGAPQSSGELCEQLTSVFIALHLSYSELHVSYN